MCGALEKRLNELLFTLWNEVEVLNAGGIARLCTACNVIGAANYTRNTSGLSF